MEFSVKTGENLKCHISGKESNALVRVWVESNGSEIWISRESLQKLTYIVEMAERMEALPSPGPESKVSPAIENPKPLENPVPIPTLGVGKIMASRRVAPPVAKDSPEVVGNFDRALKDLADNPPGVDRNGNADGTVPESAIREVVAIYAPTFKNKNGMFKPLKKHFKFEKQRFDSMIGTLCLS